MDLFEKKISFIGKEENMNLEPPNIEMHNSNYEYDWGRPSLGEPYFSTSSGSKLPLWTISPFRIFDMAKNVGDLRLVHEIIQREVFRNGITIRQKYKYKCLDCLKEFKETPTSEFIPLNQPNTREKRKKMLECDSCGNTDGERFKEPDPKNRVILQTLLDDPVNNNGQTLVLEARQIERDLETIDYACTVITNVYKFGVLKKPDPETGATQEAIIEKFDEIIRVHPATVTPIANSEGRLGVLPSGKPAWICPKYIHREKFLDKPFCDICGTKAFTAAMETNAIPYGFPGDAPKQMRYAKHEVVYIPGKYSPGLLTGDSLLNAIWKKVMSLFYQDEYMYKYFDKDRPPKSLLVFGSRNQQSVDKFMEMQRQGARSDPYMPSPVLLKTDDIDKSLKFVDLTPNFKELELKEFRAELRQIIVTIYGLEPIMVGDLGTSGISNSQIQISVVNRAIKWHQRFLNENHFRPIAKTFGVYDWEIILDDSEVMDEMRELEIKGKAIANAVAVYQMGFDVHTNGDGELIISQYPNPERQAMMEGMGSDVRRGRTDKTKGTERSSENATNFDGQPKENRPSDPGGSGDGGMSSGNSPSMKSFDIIKDIILQGTSNGWTTTTMSKRIAEQLNMSEDEALYTIKQIIDNALH